MIQQCALHYYHKEMEGDECSKKLTPERGRRILSSSSVEKSSPPCEVCRKYCPTSEGHLPRRTVKSSTDVFAALESCEVAIRDTTLMETTTFCHLGASQRQKTLYLRPRTSLEHSVMTCSKAFLDYW